MSDHHVFMLFEAFTKYTSFHGARHACQRNTKLYPRIIWIIIVIIAVILSSILIGKSVAHYLEYKTVSKYSRVFEEELEFPGISICNMNVVSKTRVKKYYETLSINYDVSDVVDQYMIGSLSSLPEELKHIKIMDTILKTSQPLEQLVKLCGLTGTPYAKLNINCSAIFKGYLSNLGFCYTLNSEDKKFFVSREQGLISKLMLLCDIEKEDYYLPASLGYGIFVEIHDPGIHPNIGRSGLIVAPGQESHIFIKKQVIKRLGLPYSTVDCIQPEQYPDYSYHKCVFDCYDDVIYKNCNCTAHSMGGSGCSLYDFYTCAMVNYKEMSPAMLEHCNCLPNCVEVQYDYTVTSTEFPNEHFLKFLDMYGLHNHTMSYYKENYLHLLINYRDLEVTVTEEVPAITIEQLLSDIGGLLGLFLGISVITICECIQFMALLARHTFCKSSHEKSKPDLGYSQAKKDAESLNQ